eukprot:TRINITY_DN60122_c0_g1_i1.p1 TRINITY_DN60122_c0_g1~~TRINITY_DN60122_c0_g1_i1.p1  ORF type:complete len:500 (-),score=91.45 TRINITY_DN60122_c0_g1_i1:31-1530(-)
MQQAVDASFSGLKPRDFGQDVRFVSAETVRPPPGFELCWTTIEEGDEHRQLPWTSDPEKLEQICMVMLLVDLSRSGQANIFSSLVSHIDAQELAPPMLCLPISPGGCDHQAARVTKDLLELGMDDVLEGEPRSFGLVLAAKAAVERSVHRVERVTSLVKTRAAAAEHLATVRSTTSSTLWEHLRQDPLPALNPALAFSNGTHIAGWTLGRQLSSGGMFGAVYEAHPPGRASVGSKAMKVIPKSIVTNFNELSRLKRMLRVLETLRSKEGRHPGIAAMQSIWHTSTHIFIRLELGSDETLYQRLGARDRGETDGALSAELLASIARQLADAVGHLHSAPRICHRDIKPENITLASETAEVQLTDFDLAMSLKAQKRCRSSCGTFPFMAPEVVIERDYCGFAADMWSVGMVLLELFCGRRVVELALGSQLTSGSAPTEKVVQLRQAFDAPGVGAGIFQNFGVPESRRLQDGHQLACDWLLCSDAVARCTAEELLETLPLKP